MPGQATSAPAESDPHNQAFAEAFAAFLLDQRRLDLSAAQRARRAAESAGERFDQVLTKLGILSEADLAASLASFLDLPLYREEDAPQHPLLIDEVPPHFVMRNRILPLRLEGDTLSVGVVDPLDRVPMDSLRFVTDKSLRFHVMPLADFERVVATVYKDSARNGPHTAPAGSRDLDEHDLQRLKDSASEAPIIRLVNQIITDAVDARASDIYVEPTSDSLVVRCRVDGVLRKTHEVPQSLRPAVISRIKILSRLDIAERRLPQDGRIKLALRGHEIDFRVATIPTINGETVTIRILDRTRVDLNFASLGFSPHQTDSLKRLADHPNGIVLVTGPTGSGKTTTLYALLKHINRPTAKIFTVEDPIEYQLPGISQVQVQEAIELGFPACLRSILRHHPDMIMIGEIRDVETASIAVQASLTGHLVFSTVHTNSAAETVTRLLDMGIEHFLLGSSLRGIMAQRLVRRLCSDCARPHEGASALAGYLRETAPRVADQGAPRLFQAVGCPLCQGAGFRGQIAISEIMHVDEEIREAVRDRRSGSDIEALSRVRGTVSMFEDGAAKVWSGTTTIEEVLRVTSAV